jgi:sugar lactone lactonase YvrE
MPTSLATPLPTLRNQLGEGVIWHARTGQLYWVDIAGHTVHSYEPASGRTRTALVGESVGTVVPTRRAEVLIARQRDFAFLDLDHGRIAPFPPSRSCPDQRFNDGKCDADGRLWVGSMDCTVTPGDGRLWCLEPSLRADPVARISPSRMASPGAATASPSSTSTPCPAASKPSTSTPSMEPSPARAPSANFPPTMVTPTA